MTGSTAAVLIALVCALAFVACHWLTLRSEETRGRTVARVESVEADREALRKHMTDEVALYQKRVSDLERDLRDATEEMKRLSALENQRQLRGR